ncbi:purine catabolism regulatory protein PucR (plasmid) [Peptoclostridium acidaminophilum DSM 3953]|uniref:Purine catabolism regulatory protein PucR n=1 Tax=Peptoclostridium acidaminophilum DSM 3953 TaxID=1286171 RepID=W8TKG2_PEPAC|nr:PucR family transcriptional regulator [Peptoclostridium acidaminophilum]AHM58218.1 purine catabolism regulatory protein PucR [Peptoclostridium acidaminophilum DSM 3953]
MEITVNDILKLDGFKNARVVAGESGMTNIVNNASLMEVPDIFPYVDANSLLITTLYPVYNNEAATQELIPRLAMLGLSGICIKPSRYVDEIPQVMMEQAEKFGFPIIELDEGANLSKLVSEILDLSLNKHISILKFRNYVHEHLMDLFLRGEDVDSLVDNLAKLVDFPVILLDYELNIVCASKDLDSHDISIKSEGTGREGFKVKVNESEYAEESYIKHSIKAGQTKFGYIVLLKGEVNNQNLTVAVEQASLLIASAFYKNYAVMEKEKTFQDSFIRDILQGKMHSQIEAVNKARAFGWSLEFPQVTMVLKVLHEDEKKKKDAYEYILDSRMIEIILEEKGIVTRKKFKSVYIDDSLVLFINVIFMNRVKENVIEVGKLIIEKLKGTAIIGVGISNIVEGISSFPLAYEEAHNSLLSGAVLSKDSFVSHYDDYKVFNIIKEVGNRGVLEKFLDDKLGRLLEYDKTTDMRLMDTLNALIKENFNARKAAARLFIHYNTLRYRLERIRELGIDLENGFEIGELVLAYNIYLWLMAIEE